MTENLENRCMSLRDEALQINCSDNGADVISAIIDDLKKYANYPEPLSVIVKKAVEVLKEQQVVRCNDCKYKGDSVFREDGTEYIVCWNQGYGIQHPCDWFCADGKRKDT